MHLSSPNVFWTAKILEREKQEREWWAEGERKCSDLNCPKHVGTVRMRVRYRHVVHNLHPETSQLELALGRTRKTSKD